MEEVTVTLYKIGQCGFYVDEEHEFATLAEVLSALYAWTKGLGSIGESSTYSAGEDDDFLRAFCIDYRDLGHGLKLLGTWNELPQVDEGVQVLQTSSQIGHADITSVAIDAMSLPGYPAYFCFDSRRQRVLNLRFDQRLNGSRQLQKYITGFLASSSSWCVWNEKNEEELLGYSNDNRTLRICDGAEPRFSTQLVRVATQLDFIRENCDGIRKVIRRASVNPTVQEHKTFLDLAFGFLGLPVNNRLRAPIQFQYEFKTHITPVKLEEVIAKYEENSTDPWEDVGFILAREAQKTHWLSGSIARTKLQIDVNKNRDGAIDLDWLDDYLRKHAASIFESLSGD